MILFRIYFAILINLYLSSPKEFIAASPGPEKLSGPGWLTADISKLNRDLQKKSFLFVA
jgi:hypothetical protein